MAAKRISRTGLSIALLVAIFLNPAALTRAASRHHTADMAWWARARFGMFIHWGLYAQAAGYWHGRRIGGIGEWIMNNAHITRKAYGKLAARFDPVGFNADQWVKMAHDAGVKYIVITTKHHDGFCMFNTKATTYNIVRDTPWHKDPMAMLAKACKKYGVRFCTYYSVQDWHSRYTLPNRVVNGKPYWQAMRFTADGGGEKYVHYMETQLGELIHQYHPGLIWFDNPAAMAWTTSTGQHVAGWNRQYASQVFNYVRKIDPTVILNNRLWYGYGDYGTPEQHIPPQGMRGHWETCMTINNTWGYKSYDKAFKPASMLITNLIKCASGGGNYLLNVGPTGKGIIPRPEVRRMLAIGNWLRVNGVAIYGSHRTPFHKAMPFGYVTRKPGRLYLEVTHWPASRTLVVPMARKIVSAKFLANPYVAVQTAASGQNQLIYLPAKPLDAVATVIQLNLAAK